ncbi:MAG: metallophosphoesterase family protein [Desulfobacterales bacterium]|jgi:UDP-2,3-diacylglucosamine pyrophosphatase LpxH
MKAIIVSDLHIGSRYCLRENFMQFLQNIPQDHEFILNGDIIDNPYGKMSEADQELLNHFGEMSLRQKVIWIRGNHDNGYVPDNLMKIHIKRHYALQKRLFVTHGDFFDNVMPQSWVFIKTFQMLHNFRIKLGARPVHVAQYAKRWKSFYAYLRKNVMLNAVHYARENGFKAVTCGHTHYAEEQFINGIQYLNTGAWTEQPTFYVHVTDNEIRLEKSTASEQRLKTPGAERDSSSQIRHQHAAQAISHPK